MVRFLGFKAKLCYVIIQNLLLCFLLIVSFARIEPVSLPFNHLLEENGSHIEVLHVSWKAGDGIDVHDIHN